MLQFIRALSVVLFSALFASSNQANAQDFGPPYWLNLGDFALDPDYSERGTGQFGYRIVTYLPRTTLVFKQPTNRYPTLGEVRSVDGKKYVEVLTHHGLNVLVRRTRISEQPFHENYGDVTNLEEGTTRYILYEDIEVCEERPDCVTGFPVTKGDVITVESTNLGVVKVQLYRNNQIYEGVLLEDKLQNLIEKGKAINLRQRFPSYLYDGKIRNVDELGLQCGQKQVTVDRKATATKAGGGISISDLIPVINFEAKATAEKENEVRLVSNQGGDHLAKDYQVVTVTVPRNKRSNSERSVRRFGIESVIKCTDDGSDRPVFRRNLFIQELSSDNRDNNLLEAIISFEDIHDNVSVDNIDGSSSQWKVYQNNYKRIFLTSINTRSYYENAIEIWTSRLGGDANLAHILLSVFNASCPEQTRKECAKVLKKR